MDSATLKCLEDLKKNLEGELRLDLVQRTVYSTDASIYQIIPDAVFIPKNADDLLRIVRFCVETRTPLIPRGAGSNMTGGVLGSGIVIDFTKYLKNVIELNLEQNYVVVEPGIVHGDLQKLLKKHGKFFPPDPSSSDYCTIGGVAANNSSGIHAVKYGDAKDWVLDIEVILPDGRTLWTSDLERLKNFYFQNEEKLKDSKDEVFYKILKLLDKNRELIKKSYPDVVKNSSGYNLIDALNGESIDWTKLFVGSEGTLGIFSKIKLKIADIPKYSALLLASFDDLPDSLAKLSDIIELGPSACELIDDFLLNLIVKENKRIKGFLPDLTGSVLIVEFDSNSNDKLEANVQKFRDLLEGLAIRIDRANSTEEQNFLLGIRKAASPILNKVEGGKKPIRFVEDLAVHPKRLLKFIEDLKALLKIHNLESSVYGHVGAGNIHINPNIDTTEPNYRSKISLFAKDVYELVKRYNGTISGEHGDGILRAPIVNLQYGELAEVFKQIKGILDRKNIFNPGKKISNQTSINLKSLRYDYSSHGGFAIVEGENLAAELEKCHGCGTCRVYCPVASTTFDEKDTARSKVNLLRMLISGVLPSDDKTLKEVREVIDHCINCKECLTKCPTAVDVPLLCVEAKKILTRRFGRNFTASYVGDVNRLVEIGASFAPVTNYFLKNDASRFLAEKFIGIDKRREFQKFNKADLKKFKGALQGTSGEKVLYHPGAFALYNDPKEGYGTLKVLLALGILPEIHDDDCCYVAPITNGALDDYIDKIRSNILKLKQFVDKGYKIVTSSASCGLAMKVEYPALIHDENSIAVAKNVFDIHEYLLDLKERGLLKLKFKEKMVKAAFHNPCHLTAQKPLSQPEELLKIIPGLKLVKINDSCCGIAGTFGMKKKNFNLSMEIGEKLFKEIMKSGANIVITSCGTCKMQIAQGTGLPVVHTMEFLADVLE